METPPKHVFDSESDFIEFLKDELETNVTNKDFINQIAVDLAAEFQVNSPPTGFGLMRKRWVIRDEDIELIDIFATAALASITISSGGIVGSALVSVLTVVAKLLLAVHKKGITISPNQRLVLIALKSCSDGCSIDQVTKWLTAHTDISNWDTDTITEILKQLQNIATKDGSVISIAQRDAAGKWYASGV